MSITPPDPNVIRAHLNYPDAANPFTVREAAFYNSPETMRSEYGISATSLTEAQQIMGSSTANPFSAIPEASNRSEYYDAIRIFDTQSGVFMDPDDASLYPANGPAQGYHYPNLAQDPQAFQSPGGGSGAPADITEVPTSTTNPSRPRTVGAGYDPDRQCLTVVFRDGTYYNYYGVSNLEWANFKRARSKGRFILTYLDQKSRGAADVTNMSSGAREALYRVSRTGQIKRQGLTGTHSAKSKRGSGYRSGNLGGTGRRRRKKAS